MLVEDDTNLSEIYQARLQAEGFEIISAKDGEEALALAVNERPDLIICDVMMPRISGFDMLDILRGTAGIQDTKVIMMTALSQAEDKARAEKLGANRYLVKSQVTLEDVVKTVHEVLGDNPQDDTKAQSTEAAPKPAETSMSDDVLPKDEPEQPVSNETNAVAQPTIADTTPAPASSSPTDIADDQTTKAEENAVESQIQSFVDDKVTEEPILDSSSGHSMNNIIEPTVKPTQTDIHELVNAEDKKTIEGDKNTDETIDKPEPTATSTDEPVKKTEPELDPNKIAL